MIGFMECPEEHCDLIAEVVEIYSLRSTDGPVRHVKTRCVVGHFFDMPENRNWTDSEESP